MTYQTMRLAARALTVGCLKIAVTGLEHIPVDGPVLLIARHYHHLFDGVVLVVSVPRTLHFLVTFDWVKNNYARRLLTLATAMVRWPVVPRSDAPRTQVDRHRTWERIHQLRGLLDSVAVLTEGRVLVVFPEGYPNIDRHYTPKTRLEEILPFRSGFATVAAAAEKRSGARIPIIPTGFHYTKDNGWTARLNIGEAVYGDDFVSRQSLVSYMEQRVAELCVARLPSRAREPGS